MIPDPDADELAYIDEVCREDDRLRAERACEAERRAAAAQPVRKTGQGGLVYKEHANNPPARALRYDEPADEEGGADSEVSLFGNPEIDRAFFDVMGASISEERWRGRDELKQALDPLREDIVALRTELRGRIKGLLELRGAFRIRGPYHENERYQALDVVSVDGRWFVARCDGPGPCPGLGWEPGPEGNQGAQGLRGPRGAQGPPGKNAREWIGVKVDRASYSLRIQLADGSEGPTIPLRPLFEQFLSEVEQRGP